MFKATKNIALRKLINFNNVYMYIYIYGKL